MIDLVDVIRDLRTQIGQAQLASAGEDLQFEVGPIELEMSVAVTAEVSGQAKVRFYVLEMGAGGKESEVSTQRIKMTLTPRGTKTGNNGASESETEKALAQALVYVTGKELAGER
ncbi:trypco2 family protein [Pseudarthrobacter sp. fls2-241-R2A-168]|uniref:trypco2 family protein n=1 Tax=Pseudarthrobacter sp. fls2-241-R2A-168 TaxID=3040304 RepID=UPI0025533C54|nr:trypco2 family protein [Pseudarthrobacter sp. fls2-241-R2A-168]